MTFFLYYYAKKYYTYKLNKNNNAYVLKSLLFLAIFRKNKTAYIFQRP